MNSLDPRSLIIMANFMTLVMGAVLGFMQQHYPSNIRGLRQWAFVPVVWSVAAVAHLAPPGSGLQLPLLLANACVLAGFVLFHLGCQRFLEQPRMQRTLITTSLALLLSLAWFVWVVPSYPTRLVLVTATISALHIWTFLLLSRHGPPRFPTRLVQIALLAHVAVLLVRLVTAASAESAGGLLEPSEVQTFYIGAYVMTVLMLCIGAVLMATDRVRTEFEHMATHDGLTGALNRRAILALCHDEHKRSQRQPRPFSLMMLDLDHFKTINDTHGHQHGDRVLVHFADRMRAVLRGTDRLGRYGGEEFLVLLPETDARAASALAQRIHAALACGHALDCQVSIGVADWQGPGDSVDALLGRADAALYRAKAQGRSQTCTG
ncbi:GGDEF domain-containing protein [Melaminivora sp.]|uniref:GGDEF domain-containing protein n=1 Tax=Melaminivora sp. TaxID=1933032 RepID=UPI0028AB0471|nr:GGDEF domain-containing protein [Melaminivora sp.]